MSTHQRPLVPKHLKVNFSLHDFMDLINTISGTNKVFESISEKLVAWTNPYVLTSSL